jgi:hypothetical protein
MSDLTKQFWLLGFIPILILYMIDMHFAGKFIIYFLNDCLVGETKCSTQFIENYNRLKLFFYSLSVFLFSLTFWNIYRIFKLTKINVSLKTKIIVRSSVIVIPIFAIILFPLLAYKMVDTPSLFINLYYDMWVSILQFLGGSPGEFGMGYYIANILIFVIIQPSLILLFFILWVRQRKKNIIGKLT